MESQNEFCKHSTSGPQSQGGGGVVCALLAGFFFVLFFLVISQSVFLGAKVCSESGCSLKAEGSGGSAQVEEGAEFSPSGEAADLSTSCSVK